jgi:mono/diheme cytochrome c family protein
MKQGSVKSFVLFAVVSLGLSLSFAGAVRAADPAPSGEAAGANKVDWDKLSFDERKKLMKAKVLPELKQAFQAFNPKRYEKFTCATCHGDGATTGKFKMPNPKLPKLPAPTDRDGLMALQKKKPDVFKFMETVVKPKVAGIIGLHEWSMENPKGFGCFACHTSGAAN